MSIYVADGSPVSHGRSHEICIHLISQDGNPLARVAGSQQDLSLSLSLLGNPQAIHTLRRNRSANHAPLTAIYENENRHRHS